jgi:hypothetical protein
VYIYEIQKSVHEKHVLKKKENHNVNARTAGGPSEEPMVLPFGDASPCWYGTWYG